MHPSVHSRIIYNCQDTEATYVFINRWMDQDVVYVVDRHNVVVYISLYIVGFYSAIKKKLTDQWLIHETAWIDLNLTVLEYIRLKI